MNDIKVIAGFHGVGKSFASENINTHILDSDSSNFSWLEPGVRNPDFPNNYIQHIKDNMDTASYIFVSSHDVVRKALEDNEIEYILVYPEKDLKEEYLERYRKRGNDEKFISFIEQNWDKFITDMEKEIWPYHMRLQEGMYMRDIFNKWVKSNA